MYLFRYLGFILYFYCSIASAKPPYSGGGTTVFNTGVNAYSKPANNLSYSKRNKFIIGNKFFRDTWLIAPSSTRARDGLGPLFNSNTCESCHVNDGRGLPYVGNKPMVAMLIKLSVSDFSGADDSYLIKHGSTDDPVYGDQIQPRSIHGVPAEVKVTLEWSETRFEFPDGTSVQLRKPRVMLSQLAYGELHENSVLSARAAPAMIGLGLLEAIPESTLKDISSRQLQSENGVSGKLNMVWDHHLQKTVPGRFGWKAAMPNVRQQVAAAFSRDIGITSRIFPKSSCTKRQAKCLSAPSGGKPELDNSFLDFVTSYSKTLAVPARRDVNNQQVKRGEQIFRDIACNECHVDTFKTGVDRKFPELSGQEIHPYTDLLLHDMGEGLADEGREFLATGAEWRTPPLWGIGLLKIVNKHTNLLHDGRARNVEEAILWHQGEALASRDAYVNLPIKERQRLIRFINSL